jgi:hypothetical protein
MDIHMMKFDNKADGGFEYSERTQDGRQRVTIKSDFENSP